MSFNVYTDGSCIGNGKPGAKAAIGIWVESQVERSISMPLKVDRPSNNVAELTAILVALERFGDIDGLTIHTDSEYAINSTVTWVPAQRARGWKTTKGKDILNKELIVKIVTLKEELESKGRVINIKYVRGHNNIVGNEMADYLANLPHQRSSS